MKGQYSCLDRRLMMESHQLQELISELQNGDVHQRRAATSKLSNSQDIEVVPWLIKAYADADSVVRNRAMEGLNIIGSKEALDFLVSRGIAIRDPFLLRRARLTKAGAVAGLVGTEVGLEIWGLLMTFLVDDAYLYLVIAFCVIPYALLGAVAGAVIGRSSIKRDRDNTHTRIAFHFVIVTSSIAGLIIGALPYIFNELWY